MSPAALGSASSCDVVHPLNVAYWKGNSLREELELTWARNDGDYRMKWEMMWGTGSYVEVNSFEGDDAFLDLLKPRLPAGSNCLQLGPGESKVAREIYNAGSVASLLNVDISSRLITRLMNNHATAEDLSPKKGHKTRMGFEAMDSLNLRYRDFEKLGWGQRFDVVIEKASLLAFEKKLMPFHFQRSLACIVTEVFQPAVGGLLMVAVDESVEFDKCDPCPAGIPPSGLEKAVLARRDFNCKVIENIAVYPLTLRSIHRAVKFLVVKCEGVSQEYAQAGCDAVWKRSCD